VIATSGAILRRAVTASTAERRSFAIYRSFMQLGALGRNIVPAVYRSEVVMAAITRFEGAFGNG
jgi:hypothetical protein